LEIQSYSYIQSQNRDYLRIGLLGLLGKSVNCTAMHASFVLAFVYLMNFVTW